MFIIGIDPSLSSTGLAIYKDGELETFNFNNKKPNYKWFKITHDVVDYTHHTYTIGSNFAESEVVKLQIYDEVTENLVNRIKMSTNGEPVKIFMEGYSYSSKGKIIDLVAFSTLIRYKLLKIPNAELTIIPPSSLKKHIGSAVYQKDKKGVYRDDKGKAAGSFDKKDMMDALLRLKLDYPYTNYLEENKEEILKTKDIPKPFDDVTDAVILAYHGCTQHGLYI